MIECVTCGGEIIRLRDGGWLHKACFQKTAHVPKPTRAVRMGLDPCASLDVIDSWSDLWWRDVSPDLAHREALIEQQARGGRG